MYKENKKLICSVGSVGNRASVIPEQVGAAVLDLCSGGSQFESQLGHQLPFTNFTWFYSFPGGRW
jgi:hypothetical protein